MPKTPSRLKRPATARAKRDTNEHAKHASISFEPGRSAHLLPTDKPTTGRSDTRTAPTDFATFMANRVSENIAVRRARIDSVQTHKMPVFLPPQEVMKMLGISRTTLNAMSKDGRLPAPICFGSRMPRWNAEELMAHLRNLSTKTVGTL